jgi:hypothetical protein
VLEDMLGGIYLGSVVEYFGSGDIGICVWALT